MTKEDKELLLKDLCARLPYRVICDRLGKPKKLLSISPYKVYCFELDNGEYMPSEYKLDDIKPYLRPMSSMTGEEMFEIEMMNNHSIQHIDTIGVRFKAFYDTAYNEMYDLFDWLNAHHFDFRGLIEKGLALKAPEDMYKTK